MKTIKMMLVLSTLLLSGCISRLAPKDIAYNPIDNSSSNNNNTFKGWIAKCEVQNQGIGCPYYGFGPLKK
tara:strand:+ start:1653 stop:1862 length:210 start_codon:yes stop_codon:yes gene_type:complete